MKKWIVLIQCWLMPWAAQGGDVFTPRVYTETIVSDGKSEGQKGAVQLLWERGQPEDQYEVQISNGYSVYSDVSHKNFKHVMVYFDRDYKWRVRQVNRDRETKFSEWRPLKVIRSDFNDLAWKREPKAETVSQNDDYFESLSMDLGGD